MARVKVRIDYGGVGEVVESNGVKRLLRSKAERVLSAARARAPRDSGAYAASLTIRDEHTDRPVSRVYADVPHATRVEYGGSGTVKHRTLGGSLDAAGG